MSEHTHYPAAESGCSRSRPPARDIVFQPRRWHRAQALAPASSPCLCSRLALGAQPSRRRRRAPGAGARCGPQGRRGRPRSPSDARPSRGAPQPCAVSSLRAPRPAHADLGPGMEPQACGAWRSAGWGVGGRTGGAAHEGEAATLAPPTPGPGLCWRTAGAATAPT